MAKRNRAARRAALRNSRGSKPTRSTGYQSESDYARTWNEWIADLEESLDTATAASMESIFQIDEVVDSISESPNTTSPSTPESRRRRSAMTGFRRKLKAISDAQSAMARSYMTEAKRALKNIQERSSHARSENKRLNNARKAHEQRMERVANLELQLRARMARAYETATRDQSALTRGKLKSLYKKSPEEISGKLDDIDKRLRSVNSWFNAQSRLKTEIKKKKREKAEEDRIKELKRILKRADHSLIRRMTIDKLVDGLSSLGSSVGRGARAASGYNLVTNFLKRSRDRKDSIASMRAELQGLEMTRARRSLNSQKKNLSQVYAAVNAADPSGRQDLASVNQTTRQTLGIEEIARNTRRMMTSSGSILGSLSGLGSIISDALSKVLGALGFTWALNKLKNLRMPRVRLPGGSPRAPTGTPGKTPTGSPRTPEGSARSGASAGTPKASVPETPPRAPAPSTYSQPSRIQTGGSTWSRMSGSFMRGVESTGKSVADGARAAGRWTASTAGKAGSMISDASSRAATWARNTGQAASGMFDETAAKLATYAARIPGYTKAMSGLAPFLKRLPALDAIFSLHRQGTGGQFDLDMSTAQILLSPGTMGELVGWRIKDLAERYGGIENFDDTLSRMFDSEEMKRIGREAIAPTVPSKAKTKFVPSSISSSPALAEARQRSNVVTNSAKEAAAGSMPSMTVPGVPTAFSNDFYTQAFNLGALQ